MGEGFPFDCASVGEDYTLDTTVVCSDEDDCDVVEQQEQDLEEFRLAKAVRAKAIQDGERLIQELMSVIQRADNNPEAVTKKKSAIELNQKLDEIKRNIQETQDKESEAELKWLDSSAKKKGREIRLAIKEKEIQSVLADVTAAECVDVAFVLDGTTSMQQHIAAVKENIRKIVTQLGHTNANLKIRLAMVVYRDLEYNRPFQMLDFVTSVRAFETFVGKIEAVGPEGRTGPRDTPEDVAGGIRRANQKLSWRQPTKNVFLIADSPCHGLEFHTCGKDNYPFGTPGIDIMKEMRALQSSTNSGGTSNIYFGRMTSRTDKMIERFQHYGIDLDVVDMNDAKIMAAVVTKSIQNSIFKTITATTGSRNGALSFGPMDFDVQSVMEGRSFSGRKDKGARRKAYSVIPKLPSIQEWQNQPAVQVKVYTNESVKTINDLKKPLPVGMLRSIRKRLSSMFRSHKGTDTAVTSSSTMVFRRAASPFAEGEIRIAFHGQLARTDDELGSKKSKVVMKSFKYIGEGLNDRKQYLRQMELSNIASFLAKEYNKCRPSQCGAVHVLPVCVAEENDEANEKLGSRRYCVELPLPANGSEFTRYSNNTGYWADDVLDETLLHFTEFTFQATEGYLMVSDLQGVRIESGDFYLTDPVIHCTDKLRFGSTNLGPEFINKCLATVRSHLKEKGWDRRSCALVGKQNHKF